MFLFNNLKTLFESINEYGAFVVILGVILFIVIIAILNMNSTINKFMEQSIKNDESYKQIIMEQDKAIIGQLSNLKEQLDKVNKMPFEKDLIKTFARLSNSLKDYCKQSMDEIKAERLAVYLFHNGSYSTHGIHFFKMSCVCEKVTIGSGVRERSIDHTNIPINLFDSMIEGLVNDGYYIIKRTDENIEFNNHNIFFSANKIKFVHAITIFDNDNNIIGFTLAESSNEYSDEEFNKQKEVIGRFITQVVPVLTYSEYTDMNVNK